MTSVTVSPKYQVVIPKEVRDSLGIAPGQKIQILTYQNRIELIPIQPMKKMRGFLKGIDTSVKRDKDRIRMSWIRLRGYPISQVTRMQPHLQKR